MKIKTPFVTLIVGLVIAVITVILSVRAHNNTTGTYGALASLLSVVTR
jgi:hypothetical protein